jgi:tetratricopeptide (TPR) repeat protein
VAGAIGAIAMKIIIFAALLFICVQANETAKQADTHYQKKEFEPALILYQTVPDKNNLTWYVMGNCAYQLKKYSQALIYWRRAQKNAGPTLYAMAQKNCAHVLSVLNMQSSKWSGLINWIQTMIHRIPASTLQYMVLFFLLIFLLWIVKASCITAKRLIFLQLPLNMVIILLAVRYYADTKKIAVVAKDSINLFVHPDQDAPLIAQLSGGTQAHVCKKQKEWYKINSQQGYGWARASDIVLI